jgi:hypothetical protein
MLTFQNTVCSIFIGGVSRKNNQDETVFIWEKVGLENSLTQAEGGGTGRGHVQVERQAVEGKNPQLEAGSTYVREKLCRKGSHGMVEIKLLCFRRLSPFFKLVQKGFPGYT